MTDGTLAGYDVCSSDNRRFFVVQHDNICRTMGKALVINCVLMKGDILRCFREGRMEIDGGNDCRGGDGGRK